MWIGETGQERTGQERQNLTGQERGQDKRGQNRREGGRGEGREEKWGTAMYLLSFLFCLNAMRTTMPQKRRARTTMATVSNVRFVHFVPTSSNNSQVIIKTHIAPV